MSRTAQHSEAGPAVTRQASPGQDRSVGAPPLALPADRISRAEHGPVSQAGPDGTDDLTGRAAAVAAAAGVSTETVYLAGLWALLHRYTGQDDIQVSWQAGDCGVARGAVTGESSLTSLVAQARRVVQDRRPQGRSPQTGPSDDGPALQVALTTGPCGPSGLAAASDVPDLTRVDLTWSVDASGRIALRYRADRYHDGTAARLLRHYERLLDGLLRQPEAAVSQVSMLSDVEHQELVRSWQGPRRPVRASTVAEVFAQQVAHAPDAVAVVVDGAETSYAKLDAVAEQVSRLLRLAGAGVGQRVAFCLPRGVTQVAAVLGILKSGAAFVPLDHGCPAERLRELIADSAPCVVLADGSRRAELSGAAATVIDLDAALAVTRPARPDDTRAAGPDDLAYILYTSGSTGRPKGVLIRHRSVVNFVEQVGELFQLTREDRILGYAACTYDVSVFETFSALLHGAALHVALDEERLNVRRLQRLIEDNAITVCDLPPSVMALLEPERFPRLRVAFVGGEPFSGALVNRWNQGRRFVNGYGVTEGTVTQVVQDCVGDHVDAPPVGLPMANHVAYVLDEHLQLAPYGAPGELVIGGVGLALGYLNEPELTARAFIPNHLEPEAAPTLYRTGDLVKRLPDGRLVYVGRVDRQVKINGIRIEPGEIEAALTRHPSVRQALVERWRDERGTARLVAYVCPAGDARLVPMELRRHLAEHLPPALIPSYLVPLPELPLTTSGKVNRRELPAPDAAHTFGKGVWRP